MTDEAKTTLWFVTALIFMGLLFVYGIRVEGWNALDHIALVP